MVNYWKSKVLPKIKKVFENPKKAAAAEACKHFDESKNQYSTEFEEKKTELQPKVVEIYEACSTEIKALVKEPKEANLKKHSVAAKKFLDELAKIEFPGSKPVCEAASKAGLGNIPGPVFFIFEKVSVFIPVEEKKEEATEPAAEPAKPQEETSGVEVKEDEIVVEKEEEKATEPVACAPETVAPAPATEEPAKVEEKPAEPPKCEEKPADPPKVEEAKPAEPPKP